MQQGWRAVCLSITIIALFTGCKSHSLYQPLDSSGSYGYSDTRIDSNTVRVTYRGSFTTSQETVQNYLLYRSAQITLQYGYDYFVVISGNVQPVISTYTSPSYVNSYKKGDQGYSIITPGQTSYFQKNIASNVIKLYKGQKPQGAANAYNASEVVNYLKESIATKN